MSVDKSLSSFKLPGRGESTVAFTTVAEAMVTVKAAHEQGLPVMPLGAGTNCIFLEPKLSAVFIQSQDRTIATKKDGLKILVTAGAGLSWDNLVRFAVVHNLRGIEYLSGIPGTCGAAPVQNIGAYGAELAQTLRSVEVLDLKTLRVQKLSAAECGFSYRRSIFNTAERGRFLITSITLALTPSNLAAAPAYSELAKQLPKQPSLLEARRHVLATRRSKLPDYKKTPNCGSFFKNPILDNTVAVKILKRNPLIPHWSEPDEKTKFSAAWLIDHAGVRGRHWGKISISPQHALVLTNNGDSDHKNLLRAIEEITATVYKVFGATLETEPNLLDKNFVRSFAEHQNY